MAQYDPLMPRPSGASAPLPPPASVPPDRAATPPAAPPPPSAPPSAPPSPPSPPPSAAPRHDLDDLVGQLHDELDIVASPTKRVDEALSNPLDVSRPRPVTTVIESTGGATYVPELASFGNRAGGFLIDSAVLTLLCIPGILVAIVGSGVVAFAGWLLMFAGFALATVAYARAVSRRGKWIGDQLTNTSVVSVLNGTNIPAASAGTRFVIRQLISPILLIGFIMALFNNERRALHDQIAGSIVVRPPRASWSIDDEQ